MSFAEELRNLNSRDVIEAIKETLKSMATYGHTNTDILFENKKFTKFSFGPHGKHYEALETWADNNGIKLRLLVGNVGWNFSWEKTENKDHGSNF